MIKMNLISPFGESNMYKIIREVVEGMIIGLLIIPFWYLFISQGVAQHLFGVKTGLVLSASVLMLSFLLSWYYESIFYWIVGILTRRIK